MSLFHSILYTVARAIGHMTWIRWGVRYKIFTYLTPINHEFVVPFYGGVYRGNLDNFIDRAVYFFGAHERQVMEYTSTLLTKDSVVLDIGANVGHHTLVYAMHAKEVHAFEPNPEFHAQFNALLQENNITNAHLHTVGLGDHTHDAAYYAPGGDNRGIGSFVEDHEQTNTSAGVMPVVQGDEAVGALGLERLDFIKIDVEGYEEVVLRGLQETLRRFKPTIIMEYTHGDFSSEESFRALTKGYTVHLVRANTSVLAFFNDPTCRMFTFDPAHAHGEVLLVPERS